VAGARREARSLVPSTNPADSSLNDRFDGVLLPLCPLVHHPCARFSRRGDPAASGEAGAFNAPGIAAHYSSGCKAGGRAASTRSTCQAYSRTASSVHHAFEYPRSRAPRRIIERKMQETAAPDRDKRDNRNRGNLCAPVLARFVAACRGRGLMGKHSRM